MTWNNETITTMGIVANKVYNDDYVDGVQGAINYFEKGAELKANGTTYTVKDYVDTDSGMQALLLESGGEYVIAFRGTAGWIDIGIDATIGLDNINDQYNDAVAFVNIMKTTYDISNSSLTLAGHSLGGILAQQVGATLHIEGYAFNQTSNNQREVA